MSAKLSDGTVIDTTDINRLLAIVSERAQGHNLIPELIPEEIRLSRISVKVSEIRSNDGVTVKLGNLQVKTKKKKQPEHENFIEIKHKCNYGNYVIRVWRYRDQETFGCNTIEDDRVRYHEFPYGDYPDENAVFRCIQNWLNGGGMKDG